jgi:hypothetical protein
MAKGPSPYGLRNPSVVRPAESRRKDAVYTPVVAKSWKGLISHIYSDGRVGRIQSVAETPGNFKPTSGYVHGVGAFLLASSEVDCLSLQQTVKAELRREETPESPMNQTNRSSLGYDELIVQGA